MNCGQQGLFKINGVVSKASGTSIGGLRRQIIFFRSVFSLILLCKINENTDLKKFNFAAAGSKIPKYFLHNPINFFQSEKNSLAAYAAK